MLVRFALASLGVLVSFSHSFAVGDSTLDFAHQIVPILRTHCLECHGGENAEGGLSINTRELVLESGVVEPGEASASRLIELIVSGDPDEQMPPRDHDRVPPESIALLKRWIDDGLPWEEGFTFAVNRYEPPLKPRRPTLPPPTSSGANPIDLIVDVYLAERERPPLELIGDREFMRRVHFDLVGLPPTADELAEFIGDRAIDKRARLIDRLLDDNDAYAVHWLTFWNDLLRNAYAGTGYIDGGRQQVTRWLYQSLHENKEFDDFVRELIDPASESAGFINGIKWRGDVNASQTREVQFAQNVGQVLLGINLKCASCHDSFIDHWTLAETYSLAAVYAEVPLEMHRCDKPLGISARAAWIFPELGEIDPEAPRDARLAQLASLMTHPQNGRLSRTIVNRLWHRLMGRGIVHPVDAMGTEPWNADLLDYLAVHLADNGYDLKATLRLIANSAAYQSRCEVVDERESGAPYVFGGPIAKRMTVEQFLDSVWAITKTWPEPDAHAFQPGGQGAGGQLWAVLEATNELDDGTNDIEVIRAAWGDRPVRAALTPLDLFQAGLGRPNREQVVTSRPEAFTTLEALTLANGAPLAELLSAAATNIHAKQFDSSAELVRWLYVSALSREPTPNELEILCSALGESPPSERIEDLLWTVFMLPEFQLIR